MNRMTVGMRRLLGLVSATAMVSAGIAPAAARDHGRHGWGSPGYGWGGYRPHRHYRHRGGLDAGDVIGIAALIGAVAVIASAAGKERGRSNPETRAPYPDTYPGDRKDEWRDGASSAAGEDAAVDACVDAVRDEAERDGDYAEIVDVEQPRAQGDDEWDVAGRVEQRRSYRDSDGRTHRFTCAVRDGRVADVRLSADVI